jgi:hypothetical protein
MCAVAGVTEYTPEMFARTCQLLVEGALELAPPHLQLLNGQHAEANTHVEGVAHESKRLVVHAATVVAHRDGPQRSGVVGAGRPGE